jgi:signal peptidase I
MASSNIEKAQKTDFFDCLQVLTEDILSRRRQRRRIKKARQRKKNPVLDWVEAFLWAAGMVLLVNQYLVQAYQIPSGSMIDTLLIGDHIFVNKIVYGPELLPGLGKLPSPVKPKRNDIVIFENPAYSSRGVAFDIAQRVIYMLSLTLIDIDRDENGAPKPHFLIKRAVGAPGDRFVSRRGDLRVRFAGEDRWVEEGDYNAARGFGHRLSRLIAPEDYPALEAAGRAAAYAELGLRPPALSPSLTAARIDHVDSFAYHRARLELLRAAQPQESRYRALLAKYTLGWYVPEGRILPLGDNRDNSQDGRVFGPVKTGKVLGRGLVVYWPGGFSLRKPGALRRFGPIK